jgi:transglutaminase-like putative cysteine protease
MRKLGLIICLFIATSNVYSQYYLFDSIPDNLKRRSDAVIRTDQCLFTIIRPGRADMKIKRAITLLNEQANLYRYITVYYDKASKINYLRGNIYDEKGKIVKVLGPDDIFDMSAISGGSFYTDDRMKLLYFPPDKFPFTIEYEYEVSYFSLISFPTWIFQSSRDVSVEKSGIQFIVPKGMKFRYLEENLKNDVDSVILPDKSIYTWQEENLPANPLQQFYAESVSPVPDLHTAPLDFEYAGFKGSMRSWSTFGDWAYTVNKDRDNLPPEEIKAIKDTVSGVSDTREKIKLVYDYVLAKTRYVSIQINIGGYRTAEASEVSKNGFGDCKALANYMMSLLKVLGIKSYCAWVGAGANREINTGFIADQFNHVILCVPMKEDSIWLDCTNKALPFNFLGDFTSDRHVLLLTPEGGKLVRTPGFDKDQNMLKRSGIVYLNILGASSARMTNYYAGYKFETANSLFSMQSEKEMKDFLYSDLRFSDLNVSSVGYIEKRSEHPSATFSYEVSVPDFATTKGSRIYFNPSLSRGGYIPDIPVKLKIIESEIISDSISYIIPPGYKVEYLPEKVSIENKFGKFSYKLELIADQIVFKRSIELIKSTIPIEKFNEFRDFSNSVAKTDREKIILIKQDIAARN